MRAGRGVLSGRPRPTERAAGWPYRGPDGPRGLDPPDGRPAPLPPGRAGHDNPRPVRMPRSDLRSLALPGWSLTGTGPTTPSTGSRRALRRAPQDGSLTSAGAILTLAPDSQSKSSKPGTRASDRYIRAGTAVACP